MTAEPPSTFEYRTYNVSRKDREPLLDFMLQALHGAGCRILYSSSPSLAPFRITFETPEGERMGIVAYAFLANSRLTLNRPADEHRFQLKYGSKDGQLHELWQDPFGMYTTLLVGINTEQGFFVGADPVLHNPTRLFISIEFKQHHADQILEKGWHAWERERLARLDFQRTRAAKSDPCSRYYSPRDFDVVAACLHAVTEKWEFRFALPHWLGPHKKCPGKLSSNVQIDGRWSSDPLPVLRAAVLL